MKNRTGQSWIKWFSGQNAFLPKILLYGIVLLMHRKVFDRVGDVDTSMITYDMSYELDGILL